MFYNSKEIFHDARKIGSYLGRDIIRLRSGDDTDMKFYRKIMVDDSISEDFYKELEKNRVKYYQLPTNSHNIDSSYFIHAIDHINKKDIEILIINTDERDMQFMDLSFIEILTRAINQAIPVYILIHIPDFEIQLMRKMLKENFV